MDIDRLRPLIYEAAFVPELWPKVLDESARIANAMGGTLFALDNPAAFGLHSRSLDAIWDDFIGGGWSLRNSRLQRALASETEHFLHDADLFSREEMARDEWFSVFCAKWNLGGSLGTIISLPNGGKLLLSLERGRDAGYFSSGDVQRFNRLRPDLGRAAVLMADMAFQHYRSMTSMLGSLGIAAAVVTGQRRLVAANTHFEDVVPTLAIDRLQKLHLSSPAADLRLEEALARLGHAGATEAIASIPVISEDRKGGAAVVHVLPIVGAAHDFLVGGAAVLVFSSSRPQAAPSHTLIKELFDLSPAEARVASRLVHHGGRLADVASDLDISRETVRSQSKSVYHKIGLRGVEDLIALVSRMVLPRDSGR